MPGVRELLSTMDQPHRDVVGVASSRNVPALRRESAYGRSIYVGVASPTCLHDCAFFLS